MYKLSDMVLESTVSIAKVGTKSVRATIPEGIVNYLDIQVGDKLEWYMEDLRNERVAVVTKKKKINRKEMLEDPIEELIKEQKNKGGKK